MTDADLALGYLDAGVLPRRRDAVDAGAAAAALGRLAGRLASRRIARPLACMTWSNENMAGAARVAIAERGRMPGGIRAAGDRRRGAGACLACGAEARRRRAWFARRAPARAARIGMLMAPARVDRVASFNARWLGPTARAARTPSSPRWRRRRLAVLRETGAEAAGRVVRRAGRSCAISARAARSPCLCRTAGPGQRARRLRGGLPGAVRPHAAWRRGAIRRPAAVADRADAGRRRPAELPRPAGGAALKGRRRSFFPEAGGTLPTPVYDRYALAAGARSPARRCVEERREHLRHRPRRRGRACCPDGSILAEIA